jgi:hypothetical protein
VGTNTVDSHGPSTLFDTWNADGTGYSRYAKHPGKDLYKVEFDKTFKIGVQTVKEPSEADCVGQTRRQLETKFPLALKGRIARFTGRIAARRFNKKVLRSEERDARN